MGIELKNSKELHNSTTTRVWTPQTLGASTCWPCVHPYVTHVLPCCYPFYHLHWENNGVTGDKQYICIYMYQFHLLQIYSLDLYVARCCKIQGPYPGFVCLLCDLLLEHEEHTAIHSLVRVWSKCRLLLMGSSQFFQISSGLDPIPVLQDEDFQ